MNPFDLRGPQFLLFYAMLTIAVIYAALVLRRRRERAIAAKRPVYRAPLSDPYLIAFLRGGKDELLRTAVVSLVDRGLLKQDGLQLETTTLGKESSARKRIEQELLHFCRIKRDPKEFHTATFGAEIEAEQELQKMNLLPNNEVEEMRRVLFRGAAIVLLFFSVTKIFVALSRGRTNIFFLIMFTVLALLFARGFIVGTRRTAMGDAMLSELRNLFDSLRLRAPQIRPGGATAELALLVGVFGVSALPSSEFKSLKSWAPQPPPSSSSSCSSSSGSSCGSSCGGGCGGGCGGCGS